MRTENSGNPAEYRYRSTSRFKRTKTSDRHISISSMLRRGLSARSLNVSAMGWMLLLFTFLGTWDNSCKSKTFIKIEVVGRKISAAAANCCKRRTQWRRRGGYRVDGMSRAAPKMTCVSGKINERRSLSSLLLKASKSSSDWHVSVSTATHNFRQCKYCQQYTAPIASGVFFCMAVRRCNANWRM